MDGQLFPVNLQYVISMFLLVISGNHTNNILKVSLWILLTGKSTRHALVLHITTHYSVLLSIKCSTTTVSRHVIATKNTWWSTYCSNGYSMTCLIVWGVVKPITTISLLFRIYNINLIPTLVTIIAISNSTHMINNNIGITLMTLVSLIMATNQTSVISRTYRVWTYRVSLIKDKIDLRTPQTSNLYPCTCNHKRISLYYLLVSLTFGISGIIISLMIRLEIDWSSNRLISTENINIYLLGITLHGLLMIFFLVMPALIGSYGNYLIPIYLGASEIIYPRINNMSVLIVPSSYTIIMLSMICEYASGIGWTLYPPLSTSIILTSIGIDLTLYSLLLSGISTSLTSINFIVTLPLDSLYLRYVFGSCHLSYQCLVTYYRSRDE